MNPNLSSLLANSTTPASTTDARASRSTRLTDSIAVPEPTTQSTVVVEPIATTTTSVSVSVAVSMSAAQPSDDTAALVGGVVGGVVAALLVVALVAFIVIRIRRAGPKSDAQSGDTAMTAGYSFGNIDAGKPAAPRDQYAQLSLARPNNYDELSLARSQTTYSDGSVFAAQ